MTPLAVEFRLIIVLTKLPGDCAQRSHRTPLNVQAPRRFALYDSVTPIRNAAYIDCLHIAPNKQRTNDSQREMIKRKQPTRRAGGSGTFDLAQSYAVRLMQHLVVPTFVLDAQRRVVIWNRACERLTGVCADEVLGTRNHWKAFYQTKRYCLADLIVLERLDKLSTFYPEFAVSEQGLGISAENWCVMPRLGNQLYLAIDAGPIKDDSGQLIAVVETLRDMTDQKRAERALHALATSDGLTGLANRRSFDEALAIEWSRAQRTNAPLSLLIADVDYFKAYNDLHGHQQGDDCLRSVATVIRKAGLRPADTCARYGGEEFVILMPDTDLEGALEVAARLRKAIHRLALPHGAPDAPRHMTLSIGVASQVPHHNMPPDVLVGQADRALYAAKHLGRDRVVSWNLTLTEFAKALGSSLPERRKVAFGGPDCGN